jgi:hypothetical protein
MSSNPQAIEVIVSESGAAVTDGRRYLLPR